MLSGEEYSHFCYLVQDALFYNRITESEALNLYDKHFYVKRAVIFGLPIRDALELNLYHACLFNKLATTYYGSSYYSPYYLFHEVRRINNPIQYSLVLSHDFSLEDALHLCPDMSEKSRAVFKALNIFPNLSIEDAKKFSNSYQISILNNLIFLKHSWYISSDDIDLATKFDSNYYFLFDVLSGLDDKNSYIPEKYVQLMKESLEFLPEQIEILRLMIDDTRLYFSSNFLSNTSNIIHIIKMMHPNNVIMKNAIARFSIYDDEMDKNLVYKDLMSDIKNDWYLFDVLVHYGFLNKIGEDYVISESNVIESENNIEHISLAGAIEPNFAVNEL